jgi:hypothetical protein
MSEPGDIEDTDDLAGDKPDDGERLVRLFLRELEAHGVPVVERKGTDEFVLDYRGNPVTVSLDDLRYDFERDADPQLVVRFVAALIEPAQAPPDWSHVRSNLFLSVESTPEEPDDRISRPVTKLLSLTVVHAVADERILTSITRKQIASWRVSEDDVLQAGRQNMSGLLEEIPLEVRRIGSLTTAVFSTRSYFKPALIFSPSFKDKVADQLGWPVLALLPCREDVFLVRDNVLEKECKETERFLHFVIQEFLESRHSLTPEVLRISDEGIESVAVIGFS